MGSIRNIKIKNNTLYRFCFFMENVIYKKTKYVNKYLHKSIKTNSFVSIISNEKML